MSVAQRRKSKPGMASILQWEVSSTQVSASIETITILIIRTANRCPMPGSCSILTFPAFWPSSISESFAMRLKKHFALRGRWGGGRCESVCLRVPRMGMSRGLPLMTPTRAANRREANDKPSNRRMARLRLLASYPCERQCRSHLRSTSYSGRTVLTQWIIDSPLTFR